MAGQTIDLSAVLAANNKAVAAQDTLATQSTDTNALLQEALGVSKQNSERLAGAEQTLAREAQLATQKKEALGAKIAAQFGANPDTQGYVLGDYAKGVIDSTNEMVEAKKNIDSKQGIEFLDNPLGYLHARTTINTDIDKYNSAASMRDNYSKSIQDLETGATNAALIAKSTVATSNEATLNSEIIKAGYIGLQAANQAAIDSSRFNMQHYEKIAAISKEQAVILGTSVTQIREQKQLEISYQRLALEKENAARSAENDRFNQYLKTQKLDADTINTNLVAKGYQTLTGNPMPPELRKNVITFMDKKDPQFQAWYDSGRSSYDFDATGNSSVVANSPADVLRYSSAGYIKNPSLGTVATIEKLKTYQMEFKNQAMQNTPAYDKSDHTAVSRAFNDFVQTKLKQESQNVPPNSILAPMSLSDAAKSANFDQYPAWTKILKPLAEGGAKLSDPNVVTGAMFNAIRKRQLTVDEAADIAPMYATAMRMTSVSRNFMGLGLAAVNQGYTTNSEFGLINYTDKAAVITGMNRTMSRNIGLRP